MRFTCALHQWNMFMIDEHTISMWKNIAASILLLLILFPFVLTGFFEPSVLLITLLFSLYQLMLVQYYEANGRIIEFKDGIFTLCFVFLLYLFYRLFHKTLDSDQLMILLSAVFIAMVNVGCTRRIRMESYQKD